MASNDSKPQPVIGLTTYLEQATSGVWDVQAAFLPKVYFDAVNKAGGGSQLIWINIILLVLVGVAQFIQTKMITPKAIKISKESGQMDQFSGMLQKQMLYIMPVFTIIILFIVLNRLLII